MRFTIERLRTLVLVAGVLLVITLGVFLGTAKFRNRFIRKDLPERLGLNIQEEAKDFVLSHSVGEHMQYKIHASKQVQLKRGDKVFLQLHDVTIELYGEDGSRVDRIAGDEFEYNPDSGIASAKGPVEITLMKPAVAPAIAPKVATDKALSARHKNSSLGSAALTASSGEVHVKTSGLVFDRNSGEAFTDQKVEFTLTQGSGSAMGAKYDAHQGVLVLDREVDLAMQRGQQPVKMYAHHAVFERDEQTCDLTAATIRYGNDESSAEEAKVHFRDDGSAERVDAGRGFSLVTTSGGRLAAPTGTLEFDEHNQPHHGHLQGGVSIDSESKGRKMHGTSPTMDIAFAGDGEPRSAHLERGVQIASEEETASPAGPLRTHRTWTSPVVDIAFRNAGRQRVEPASMHGTGGVVITGSSQRGNGPVSPSQMTADDVTGEFGSNGALTTVTGRSHAAIAETSANGTLQTTHGDVLIAHLARTDNANEGQTAAGGGLQVESATVDGNVMLTQQPPAKAGTPQPTLRATAGHAEYESKGEWLHLTRSPRVNDGALELSAEKVNVSQVSGDAFALGNVKATWAGNADRGTASENLVAKKSKDKGAVADLGAQGPTHVVADQAELQHSGLATFKGKARLWQQGNSVTAPVIALDRTKQTLTALTTAAKNPVQVVLVSATASVPGAQKGKQGAPSVVRVRGGDLRYSSAERKAVMQSGAVGNVVASTADATTTSNEVELLLLPPGNHAGRDGGAAQVDRMISTGNVEISSGGRHGTGEKLVYSGDTGNYVLTGTSAALPRLTDPVRGSVSGEALIFNSRDDSVKVEGDGLKTTTVTTAPK
ncbi:MAG TPA: LPS export ABC transporter periplasmic protein LptC [Terracidiphilus sp.]|jgi:lipopolysaccharide export system protein LptA